MNEYIVVAQTGSHQIGEYLRAPSNRAAYKAVRQKLNELYKAGEIQSRGFIRSIESVEEVRK